jgi:hypothetical protein
VNEFGGMLPKHFTKFLASFVILFSHDTLANVPVGYDEKNH